MKEHAENGDSIFLCTKIHTNISQKIYLCIYYHEALKSYLMYHGLCIHLEFMYVMLCCVFSMEGGDFFLFDWYHIITITEKPYRYFLIEVSVLLGCGVQCFEIVYWPCLQGLKSPSRILVEHSPKGAMLHLRTETSTTLLQKPMSLLIVTGKR
jgi:hypothetical protein